MIKRQDHNKGFSLIEIMLATSIFAVSVMALSGGLIYAQQSALLASHRMQGVFLAAEGMEATQNIAAEDFANLVDGDFGLAVVNNSYAFNGSSDTWDIYERHVSISSIDDQTKEIEVIVSWSQSVFDEGSVTLNTYITHWNR